MSKRLQVVVGDEELECYSRTARSLGLTVSEWVRQSLRTAERDVSSGDIEAKLAAIRKAASYSFPVSDIDTLTTEIETARLAEIEAGLPGAGDA
jgi:uncharacterized membrane protein